MKLWKKILITVLATVIAIPVAISLTLRIPSVQKKLCRSVVEAVNESIDGTMEVGSINFIPFNTISLGGVNLSCADSDTLIKSDHIYLKINELSLLSKNLHINNIKLKNTRVDDLQKIAELFKKEEKDTVEKKGLPWDGIRVSSIIIDSLDFEYDSTWAFRNISLSINDLFVGDGIYGTISSFALKEKSGLEIENFCTYFLADSKNIMLKGLKYKDNWSDISIPIAQLKYNSPDDFKQFSDSVLIQATFDGSSIGFGSAGPFIKKLRGNPFNIYLDGSIQGHLSNFSARNLTIRTSSGGTNLQIAAIIKGLPVPEDTEMNIRVKNSFTSAQDITTILEAFSDTSKVQWLSTLTPKERLEINCQIGGTFDKLSAKVHLESNELGLLDGNLKSTYDGTRYIGGEISTNNVDVGKIIGNEKIGKISAYATGWAAMRKDSLRAEIVSAEINRLDFNGYGYSGISGGCSINNGHYRGEISSLDTNCFFKLIADLNLDKKGTSTFNGSGNFNKVDLAKLNLVQMDTCLTSFMINFDFNSNSYNNLLGSIDIHDLVAVVGSNFYDIGPVSIHSTEDGDYYSASIESSLLTASYQGSDYLFGMVADAATLLTAQMSNAIPLYKSDRKISTKSFGEFNLETGDLTPIASLLPKNVYIDNGTSIKFMVEDHKKIDFTLNSGLLSYEDKFIKDISFRLSADDHPINLSLTADRIQSASTAIDRDTLTAAIENNTIVAGLSYNDDSQRFGQGKVNAEIIFPDKQLTGEKLIAKILPSRLKINEQNLEIDSSRVTVLNDQKIKFENFNIRNGESFLHLDGSAGKSKQDSISLELKDFNLAGLNFLFKKKVNLKGVISGGCTASGITGKELSFLADFKGKNIGADDEDLGDLNILSKWDEVKQQINFLLTNEDGGAKPLNVVGSWSPDAKALSVKVDMDKFNIGWVDPFLVGVMDHTKGTASGKVEITGKEGVTKINSEGLRLNDIHTTVSYTEVPYVLDGPFRVDETGVYIDEISIKDSNGKGGTIKGSYWLTGEKKKEIDLLFDLHNVLGLNTTFQDANQGFWGKANATGRVRVYGPFNGLRFNIDITTEEGEVHIPLDESKKVNKRDILTFVNRNNTAQTAYDSITKLHNINQTSVKRKGGVKCNIRLRATPQTALIVDINSATDDKATVIGNGQVEMRTGEGQFDIRGSYQVHEGDCRFTILGITTKNFTIREGGVINFVGPVMESDFKLSAAYMTKASLETLFGDTQSVSNRRTVNCVVNLTGKLDNPKIAFKIDIPDLDPSYKSKVESALSTEEKNLRQGLALLVSGGFIPDQQSGIVNSTTFLYSNASEIVSSQISNIFHQLNIPVDLGLKYQPGNSGTNIFDVAISTQLFNNRVTINGSIGNKEYATSGSNSYIIGNVDVGIKLNKSGQLKLNVFSHAADQYSNYLDQSQRNGAGVTYQEEFATFKELWQKIFKPKQEQVSR